MELSLKQMKKLFAKRSGSNSDTLLSKPTIRAIHSGLLFLFNAKSVILGTERVHRYDLARCCNDDRAICVFRCHDTDSQSCRKTGVLNFSGDLSGHHSLYSNSLDTSPLCVSCFYHPTRFRLVDGDLPELEEKSAGRQLLIKIRQKRQN